MHALREHARCQDFVLLRDSKLLSTPNRRALLRAVSATWPRWPAHPSWTRRCWPSQPRSCCRWPTVVSGNGASRPRSGRATTAPTAHGGEQVHALRRLFVLSSEERAACRRNRARQRERAEAEILGVLGRVGTRWYPTAERAFGKIAATLQDGIDLPQLWSSGCWWTDHEPGAVACYFRVWSYLGTPQKEVACSRPSGPSVSTSPTNPRGPISPDRPPR